MGVSNEKEVVDEIDREAGEAYPNKKRPRFSFEEMNIPAGSELINVTNSEIVILMSYRKIKVRDEDTSLTNATRIILGNSYHVAPGPYWTYNGRSLRTIYSETYPSTD